MRPNSVFCVQVPTEERDLPLGFEDGRMFGRLRVNSCSLGAEGSQSYRADFCSLCHSLREQDGYLATLLTNFDNTFWLTVATGLSQTPVEVQKRRCTAVPLRSVMVRQHSPQVSLSNVSLLWMLVRAKAEDDVDDEGSWKAKAALKFSISKAEKAERYLSGWGYDVSTLRQLAVRQKAAEARSGVAFEEVSRPTAEMMAEAFGHLAKVCDRREKAEVLREFGWALGVCIYLWDALDDHGEDLKAGRFNPLFRCPDVSTRGAIATVAGSWLERLRGLEKELGLSPSSEPAVRSALSKIERRLREHGLLSVVSAPQRARIWRRQGQAAFCLASSPHDPERDRRRDQCCSELEGCEGCECCCEGTDGCSCCGCDSCSGCDGCGCDGCSGCDGCFGCSASPRGLSFLFGRGIKRR